MSQRINITLSDDDYRTLKATAERDGQDMSEFIRQSFRVYRTIKDEARNGRRIYIGKDDRAEKELLVP